MENKAIYEFLREHRYGVLATVSPGHAPEAALVGIAVTPALELIFDAIETTRKIQNLRRNPYIAFVVGWSGDERTVQYEGIADEPKGAELERAKETYCAAWPTAPERDMWPGHIYVRVRPKWLRFSSYKLPYKVEEMTF
jgi:pyridoxine/pyridoxamine 5'-phosphate oxidase